MSRIFYVIILAFFVCCKHSEPVDYTPVISANIDDLSSVSIFDFVDSISVVPLETTDSCIISNIRKVIKKKENLYILDLRLQTVFCFTTEGKYKFKVCNYGKGPNEYQYVEDFAVNENGHLFLLEPWGAVFQYNSDGSFVQKIKLNDLLQTYNEIFSIDSSLVFTSVWGKMLHFSLNSKKTSVYDIAPPMNAFYILNRSYVYNNKFRMLSLFDAKIQEITNEGIMDCYIWDFGTRNNEQKK